MIENIDVLVFDVQDVGTRIYTYTATMAYAMQACAEHNKEFIVLDRPNPINGIDMEGPVLDYPEYSSFVGLYPIPEKGQARFRRYASAAPDAWRQKGRANVPRGTYDGCLTPRMGHCRQWLARAIPLTGSAIGAAWDTSTWLRTIHRWTAFWPT